MGIIWKESDAIKIFRSFVSRFPSSEYFVCLFFIRDKKTQINYKPFADFFRYKWKNYGKQLAELAQKKFI